MSTPAAVESADKPKDPREDAVPFTTDLIEAMIETGELYKEDFGLIGEEQQVYDNLAAYAKIFRATLDGEHPQKRVFERHTSLLQDIFKDISYECLVTHRFKVRVAELTREAIELGRNRGGQKTGFFLPLGPVYVWAQKLRTKFKTLGLPEKVDEKPDPRFVLQHKILLYVMIHIKGIFHFDDKKSIGHAEKIIQWREINRVKLLKPEVDESGKSRFRQAMDKVRDLLSDDMLTELIEALGFDVDEEEIKKAKERFLGDENGEGGLGSDELFEQLSNGELDRDKLRALAARTKGTMDSLIDDEPRSADDYEEETRLEEIEEGDSGEEAGGEEEGGEEST